MLCLGPRNLNAVSKDKGKSIQVAEIESTKDGGGGENGDEEDEVAMIDDSTQAIHDFDDLDL